MDKFVIIDLETTGHAPSSGDRIIDIGIVIVEDRRIVKEYTTLINPNQSIPPFISNLTNIKNTDVTSAPEFKDIAAEIVELTQEGYIVAHNILFDLGFLNTELANLGLSKLKNPVLDTVELSRILFPQAPGFQLGQLAEYFSLGHNEPHRALSDAKVTAELLIILLNKISSLPVETISHLLKLEKKLQSDLYAILFAEEQTKNKDQANYSAYKVFQGLAYKKWQESTNQNQLSLPSFGHFLDDIIGKDGSMGALMDHFEERSGQRELSETIYDAFQSEKHALIEAGTGTGKTIAYLLPALYRAVNNHKTTVISTYTTQLQAQIMDEEIPLLRKLVSFPFKVALLKGKNHYISLERFAKVLQLEQEDNYDHVLTKAILLIWITETTTGDIDEIQLSSSGYLFFQSINSEEEKNHKSPWSEHSYYQKAREEANQAHIVITNHALFAMDIIQDVPLLPEYEVAIIDEAHHLESVVSERYGMKIDYIQIQHILNKIASSSILNKAILKLIEAENLIKDTYQARTWQQQLQLAKQEVDELFRSIFQYVVEQKEYKAVSDIGRIQYRIQSVQRDQTNWKFIIELTDRVILFLSKLSQIMSDAVGNIDKEADKNEVTALINALVNYIDELKLLIMKEDSEQIRWIEVAAHGAKNAVFLYREPKNIAPVINEKLFEGKKSIVLTSATLTTSDSFSFIKQRLGISEDRLIMKKIDSPFSFENQVQLLIPDDFPDINHTDLEDYIISTCEAILSLAEITKGKMLVLFTSYDMLKKSYYLLKEMLDLDEYVLIAQGISSGSRSRLKKNFQTFEKAILLGTSSFWEGVDIPGEDLSCVVIARLPFDPPTHPIQAAKAEDVTQRGKNAFYDFSLPNAVIRFKQGFGRLIRSKTDRGIVFVCDARIMKSRYGKTFIKSIPTVPITYDSTTNLMKKAEEWF
ncbi:ATP-dependent DNA helicase DinG [Ornithinibacillus sp. 4-3]|uniref:3'-5' exonuclease DinG n=1 Tax=Ornithinibacillus sp. 4-3 TaxID=3231488 RepID=A0AB39HLC2_9BACI